MLGGFPGSCLGHSTVPASGSQENIGLPSYDTARRCLLDENGSYLLHRILKPSEVVPNSHLKLNDHADDAGPDNVDANGLTPRAGACGCAVHQADPEPNGRADDAHHDSAN